MYQGQKVDLFWPNHKFAAEEKNISGDSPMLHKMLGFFYLIPIKRRKCKFFKSLSNGRCIKEAEVHANFVTEIL